MIPGITDDDANVRAIASFISGLYPDVRYEILNYHPLAAAKYDVLPGRTYVFDRDGNPAMLSSARMDALRDVARDAGVKTIVVD